MILALILLVLAYFVLPALRNPLSGIPGPWRYKLTKLFILNDQRLESRALKVHRMHAKYGSIVQVAPNEVSFSSLDLVNRVYVKERLDKSSFYAQYDFFGVDNIFSITRWKEHKERKSLGSSVYTKRAIFEDRSQRHMNTVVMQAIGLIHQRVDVYELFHCLAMDIVSFYELGHEHKTHLLLDHKQRWILKSMQRVTSMWFYTTLAPQLWALCANEQIQSDAIKSESWGREIFTKAYADIDASDGSLIQVLHRQSLPKWEIASEVFDHLVAGHETSATTMTYVCWELSRPMNKHIQWKLRQELGAPRDYVCFEDLEQMEYLDCVVMETLRLHAATPGCQPRVIRDPFPVTIQDKTVVLPRGTIVSAQPYTMNRSGIFIDPNRFIPERWLVQDDETPEEHGQRVKQMKSHMFSFGKGTTLCIGMHIAMMEIKLAMAQIYSRYESKLDGIITRKDPMIGRTRGRTDVELMSMADCYVSRPLFDECWLTFDPVEETHL